MGSCVGGLDYNAEISIQVMGTKRSILPITYVFKSGRLERLAEYCRGPTEFFYGYQQLRDNGVDVSILADSEVGMGPPLSIWSRIANKFSPLFARLPLGTTISLLINQGCRKLDCSRCVVATTNTMGLALAIAKALGQLDAPVLLIAMGLLPMKPTPLQSRLTGTLAKHIHIACISISEQSFLQHQFPGQSIHYIPFGVDIDFWHPAASIAETQDYVLAIGNDANRDWETLVAAWGPDLPLLKIVTSLPVPPNSPNVEVIRGDWRTRVLDDDEIRNLVRGSRFVVVPLRDTIQPAGQSACLQAMACAKAVILTDTVGLWDRQLLIDGENVLLTPIGDAVLLGEHARCLSTNRAFAAKIGTAARKLVEDHLNTGAMAHALERLLESIND